MSKHVPVFIFILILAPFTVSCGASGADVSTFFGGSGDESFSSVGLAIDSNGNVFIAGVTTSEDLPVTVGAYDLSHNGDKDVFIAKFTPDLGELISCTYLGGSGEEMSCDLCFAPNGDLVVSGSTASSDFPIVEGAQRLYGGGMYDLYIALVSNDLKTLRGSSFLGGSYRDVSLRGNLAIDESGSIYVSCYTESPNFPVTRGTYDMSYGGRGDGGITVFSPDLKTIHASTFLGSYGNDWPYPLALGGGRVYVGGHVDSQGYPTSPGAFDTTYNGGNGDVFLAAFDPDLQTLIASTFLGGSGFDNINSIFVEDSGDVVVAGHSGSSDFPTSKGAYQMTYRGGDRDSFITRFDADLKILKNSTLIGGSDTEYQAYAVAGKEGDVLMESATRSSDYPYTSGTRLGAPDTTINVFDANLSKVKLAIAVGGSGADSFGAIKFMNGYIYAVASTKSQGLQCNGYDSSFNGGEDVLLIRIEYPGESVNPPEPTDGQPAFIGNLLAYSSAIVGIILLVTLLVLLGRRKRNQLAEVKQRIKTDQTAPNLQQQYS